MEEGDQGMKGIDEKLFQNPEAKYRANPIVHRWPERRDILMEAIKAYGFGGVVTNPSFGNGFTSNPDNVAEFAEIMKELDEQGIGYWLYDENGYPSGYAGGETLKGHPELESKGLYMHRRVAYEPRHTVFHLDEESDKIVWAAKYPMDTPMLHESFVRFDQMTPVSFEEKFCECDLKAKEVLYIFCVRPAYEGTLLTHNTCSFSRYINIMDEHAVRRFIDLCFEPIVEQIPDAYARSFAVFTDEPSLQVGYVRGYETWPYAMVPWVDGLFGEFEKMHGFSLLPYLPLLFEGAEKGYFIRVKFYNLVGKLVARAFSGQLAAWCEAHGGTFSGHYWCEENLVRHVLNYGSFIEVLKAAGYPGIDVLTCYPEIYNYNTAKYVQMAVRKKGTNGMMVEVCPFYDVENFSKDPLENVLGVLTILYLSGVRITHSYFRANFEEYDPAHLKGEHGYMSQEQARYFNEYVGRMGYMLDGIQNECNTFIYYPLEEAQATWIPQHTDTSRDEAAVRIDKVIESVMKPIFESGHDFYYADMEDLLEAEASLASGVPMISGNEVKTIIVPGVRIMHDGSAGALRKLQEAGVKVFFVDRLPEVGTEQQVGETVQVSRWAAPVTEEVVLAHLDEVEDVFTAEAGDVVLLKGKFTKDGHEMYFVDNNSRKAAEVLFRHKTKKNAVLYDPADGSKHPVQMGEYVTIPSFRGVFVVFE